MVTQYGYRYIQFYLHLRYTYKTNIYSQLLPFSNLYTEREVPEVERVNSALALVVVSRKGLAVITEIRGIKAGLIFNSYGGKLA